jgi:glycosyltransferase involved in cell wall biosynthesis
MKIAHILPALTKGGAERVAADLACQAVSDGASVTIVAGWSVDPALLQNALDKRITVSFVSKLSTPKVIRYFLIFHWLWRNRDWLASQDIIHCHLTFATVFATFVRFFCFALRLRRPVIVETCHSAGMPVPIRFRWLHAWMVARFDAYALVANDDYWNGFLRRHPDLPSALIPNGISFSALGSVEPSICSAYRRDTLNIPEHTCFVVGTIGRLEADRQPWLYIPIFKLIAEKLGDNVHFVLAGSGGEQQRILKLVHENNMQDKIHLPGLILEPRFPLSVMDIYITLNVGNITGIAALEAAYSGIPVIGIQLQSDYIPKVDDWIWSNIDATAVASKVIELLQSEGDRQTVAKKQAERVRSVHTVMAMAQSYEQLYMAAKVRNLSTLR